MTSLVVDVVNLQRLHNYTTILFQRNTKITFIFRNLFDLTLQFTKFSNHMNKAYNMPQFWKIKRVLTHKWLI